MPNVFELNSMIGATLLLTFTLTCGQTYMFSLGGWVARKSGIEVNSALAVAEAGAELDNIHLYCIKNICSHIKGRYPLRYTFSTQPNQKHYIYS